MSGLGGSQPLERWGQRPKAELREADEVLEVTCPYHSPLVPTLSSCAPGLIPVFHPHRLACHPSMLAHAACQYLSLILRDPLPSHSLELVCQQKDLGYLQQWLKVFVGTFEKTISVSSLEPRR